jgi:hypothetical protein
MPKWNIIARPREYQPSGGTDAALAWAFDLERDGRQHTTRVEVSGTAAAVSHIVVLGSWRGMRMVRSVSLAEHHAVTVFDDDAGAADPDGVLPKEAPPDRRTDEAME